MVRRRKRADEPTPVSDEVVLGLLQQLQSIDQRLTRVEQLLEDTELDRVAQAEQSDLIDLRLHSARLAAELSRVTVDLQARIDAVAAAQTSHPTAPVSPTAEVDQLPPPMPADPSPAWEPLPDE